MTKLKQWPNKLGWDLGADSVCEALWRGAGWWRVTIMRAGRLWRGGYAPLGVNPTETAIRTAVRATRDHGEPISCEAPGCAWCWEGRECSLVGVERQRGESGGTP